jgi:hypothetical protein
MIPEKYRMLIKLYETNNLTMAKQWIRSKDIDLEVAKTYAKDISAKKAVVELDKVIQNNRINERDNSSIEKTTAPKFVVAEKTASQICNIMGTSCNPPISFFLNSDNSLGFKVQVGQTLTEASEDIDETPIEDVSMAEFKRTSIYKNVMDNYLTIDTNPRGLTVYTKIDINLTELFIGDRLLNMKKNSYASDDYEFEITIEHPEKYIDVVSDAFAIALAPIVQVKESNPVSADTTEFTPEDTDSGGFDFSDLGI